jgi:N-acetylglutamate synthase
VSTPLSEWTEPGERAHVSLFQLLAAGARQGRFRQENDAAFFITGLHSSIFNGSVPFEDPPDIADLIRRTRDFCAPASVPWSLSLRGSTAERVATSLGSQGFHELEREPAMVLPTLDREPPPLPPGLTIRRARRPEELGLFWATLAKGFGIPAGALRPFLRASALKRLVEDPRTAWFVGFADGRAAATSLRIATGTGSYVAMVSTVPAYRRKGFGEALTWRAALSGKEAGCRVGFLRASEMGQPLYLRMGFVRVDDNRTFAAPGGGMFRALRTVLWLLGVTVWFALLGRRYRDVRWTSADS